MNTARMDEILSLMKPDEVREALWLIEVFEKLDMRAEEADEWRRRILVMRELLHLGADSAGH
jgi:hypothetical protein